MHSKSPVCRQGGRVSTAAGGAVHDVARCARVPSLNAQTATPQQPSCSATSTSARHAPACASLGVSQQERRRSSAVCHAVAAPPPPAPTSEAPAPPKLFDLEMYTIINNQGTVQPPAYEGPDGRPPAGFILAIYDLNQKLQYIGFSQDLRNTLRTLLGRRPDKAHFFKAYGVPELDQAVMVGVREAWFMQVGGAPTGNKLALERNMWQKPVDAGAISARGKQAAAEDKAKNILAELAGRGLKEKFVPNPSLMTDGQVDFLPSDDLTPEQRAILIAQQAEAAASMRNAHTIIDGQERTFQVRVAHSMVTKNGFLLDVLVSLDSRETKHRIIVGKQYIEGVGLTGPEPAAEAALSVLLMTKQSRHTDGIMGVGQFPVNYFTVSEVEQWWGPEFKQAFDIAAGRELARDGLVGVGTTVAWRFTRLHSYGAHFEANEKNAERISGTPGLGVRTSSFVYE